MPRRYNTDHVPVVVDNDAPAVSPGEPYDFTREQIDAGLTGSWSDENPRGGEKDPRRRRDAARTAEDGVRTPIQGENTDPGKPENKE